MDISQPKFKGVEKRTESETPDNKQPRLLVYTMRGIRTASDLANALSATLSDLGDDRITDRKANAFANVSGKLLKAVEMNLKYGTTVADQNKELKLTSE